MEGRHVYPPLSGWGDFDEDEWELYDTDGTHRVARTWRTRSRRGVEELMELWFEEAGVYKGLPLETARAMEILAERPAQQSQPRARYVYYPDAAEVPESVAVNMRSSSYTIAARDVIDSSEEEGVLFAQGVRRENARCMRRERSCTTSTTGWVKVSRRSSSKGTVL